MVISYPYQVLYQIMPVPWVYEKPEILISRISPGSLTSTNTKKRTNLVKVFSKSSGDEG